MNTKTSLTLILGLSTAFSFASVDPDKVVTPPLDIFSEKNFEIDGGETVVKVTSWNRKGNFERKGETFTLPTEKYQRLRDLAGAVYQKLRFNTSYSPEDKDKVGTVFHIGENLVLTNAHVLSSSFDNLRSCNGLKILDNFSRTEFSCKKVHFCSVEWAPAPAVKNDICLVEMHRNGGRSLAQGPAIKLLNNYRPKVPQWSETVLTAIGNSAGYGIHVSEGQGLSLGGNWVEFYAPITHGNSGGVLLNEAGLAVGVVRSQSVAQIKRFEGERVYNLATSMTLTIKLVREALAEDPVTLEKFNQAVVE